MKTGSIKSPKSTGFPKRSVRRITNKSTSRGINTPRDSVDTYEALSGEQTMAEIELP